MIITNMKTIIAGGRDFIPTSKHKEGLLKKLKELGTTEVVCGMAVGADMFGYGIAKELGIPVKEFPANWNAFGRSAGPIRNEEMARYADACILFPGGTGTANMKANALKYKLSLEQYG